MYSNVKIIVDISPANQLKTVKGLVKRDANKKQVKIVLLHNFFVIMTPPFGIDACFCNHIASTTRTVAQANVASIKLIAFQPNCLHSSVSSEHACHWFLGSMALI